MIAKCIGVFISSATPFESNVFCDEISTIGNIGQQFRHNKIFNWIDLKLKLAKAVHACVHEGMSQNHAANLFQISKSTLWRHLQKRVAEAEAAESESMGDEDEIKQEVILS